MENNNIIHHPHGTIIINGGDALPGCPTNWDDAVKILERLNEGKDEEVDQPRWDFDCGFKLDFDGPILRVSSKFYPPRTYYGSTWDGTVRIHLMEKQVAEKKFDCQTIEELKEQVENYLKRIVEKLQSAFQ